MGRHARVNYARYRTAGGSYETGCGQTIVNLYDGDGDVRPSCYTCRNCAEKHCMINGMAIPQLGKNTYRDCRFFNGVSRLETYCTWRRKGQSFVSKGPASKSST